MPANDGTANDDAADDDVPNDDVPNGDPEFDPPRVGVLSIVALRRLAVNVYATVDATAEQR